MNDARQLVSLCTENHLTISSCESLTAGLFTSTIASIPGASAILKGGLVTYFTPMKSVLAHVDVDLIQKYGVISKSVRMRWLKIQDKLWMWIIVFLLQEMLDRMLGKKNQREEYIVQSHQKKLFKCMVFNVQVCLEMMLENMLLCK